MRSREGPHGARCPRGIRRAPSCAPCCPRILLPLLLLVWTGACTSGEEGRAGTLALEELRTGAEARAFAEPTGHLEMMDYLEAVAAGSPHARAGSFGTTPEGRDLPYLHFASQPGMTPEEAHASGNPVVVLGANVHGFNHVVREALLILSRELGTPGTEMNALLDRMVVLIVPSKNPDGLALGSRFNARGADLNRDYMTLDEPELAAYLGRILTPWAPHLVLDGHDGGDEQYGGAWPYHLLYQGPGLAGADPRLAALADTSLFPHLDAALAATGRRAFYWSRGDGERWYAGGSAPRMGRNHGGLSNRLTILFEVPAWTGLEGGVGVTLEALRGLLHWAAEPGHGLVRTVRAARDETVRLGEVGEGRIPVREEMVAAPERVTFEIGDPDREGERLRVEDAEILRTPLGTAFRDRPVAYVLPPGALEAVDLLERQGIQVERISGPVEARVRGYHAAAIRWEPGANRNRAALVVEVASEFTDTRYLPAGSWVVRTGQPLGRVVAHLLEPESGDGVFHWGRMTHLLAPELLEGRGGMGSGAAGPEEDAELPILRIMEPARLRELLPTTVIPP